MTVRKSAPHVFKMFCGFARKFCLMAVLVSRKSRLVSDPSLGVSDLMQPLSEYMEEQHSRNVEALLKAPKGTSWKTAPSGEWMASLATLMGKYTLIAPNGMIPPKKHRAALMRMHQESAINFSKKPTEDFLDWADESIRICLAQFRVIKNCELSRSRAFKKIGPAEIAAADKVLQQMELINSEQTDSQENLPAEPAKEAIEASTAMVPFVPDKAEQVAKAMSLGDAAAVFTRVLSKEDSESSLQSQKKVGKPSLKAPEHAKLCFANLLGGDLAFEVVPLGADGSQLKIFRKNCPVSARGRGGRGHGRGAMPKQKASAPKTGSVLKRPSGKLAQLSRKQSSANLEGDMCEDAKNMATAADGDDSVSGKKVENNMVQVVLPTLDSSKAQKRTLLFWHEVREMSTQCKGRNPRETVKPRMYCVVAQRVPPKKQCVLIRSCSACYAK